MEFDMFHKTRFWFYFFYVLIGTSVFLHQADGNEVTSSSIDSTTGKNSYYFFYQRTTYPRDCKEVLDQCSGWNSSGVLVIKPDGYPEPFEVYCNNSFDSGGWTVLLRRLDGSLVFSRNWADYKEGFGFLGSEFWLGNEKISFITNQQRYELRIDVMISNGSKKFMTYSYVRVNDEWGNYSLVTLGDAREKTNFSTCPTNMIYRICTCEKTCEVPTICQNNCQETEKCVCPDGFFLRGGDCVAPEDCECYSTSAGKVIPVGESYIDNQCSVRCFCDQSGLTCSDYACNPNARCTSTTEGGRCSCNAGFLGDGLDCRCTTNMIYTTCECERTCEAPNICQNNCQEAERCVCPDGFFLRGNDCVAPRDCECYSATAGKVIAIGESYVDNQCSSQCSRSESGLICRNYRCDPNARCTSTTEGGRCACKTGFVGDGLDCGCNTGYLVDGTRCRRPRDCDEVPSVEGYSGSGLYYIFPSNWQEVRVYCNMSEGRWTVFQRRIPGSTRNFRLSWNSYKTGFGELDEDFWLGNDNIHYLTSQGNYELRIDIIDSGNRNYRAQYNRFRIANEGNKYRMTVLGTFSGNAGYDAMRDHLNQPFSTHDRDNDDWDGSDCFYYYYYCYYHYYGDCAILNEGAWWYKHRNRVSSPGGCDRYTYYYYCCDRNCNNCGSYAYSCAFANLNGKARGDRGETIFWHGLSGNDCEIKFTEMKIRPLS